VFTFIDQASGAKWGLQFREEGTIIHAWVDPGTGWRWVGAVRPTATVRNGGYFGLNFQNDFVTRIDDFGGGTSIRFVPQIIRRPPDPAGAVLAP
jgi:hypothetical protein